MFDNSKLEIFFYMQTGSGYLIDTIKNYKTNISNNIDSQRLPDMIIIVTFKIFIQW